MRFLLLLILLIGSEARAQTFVETFSNGTNQTGWVVDPVISSNERTGGNPGGYLFGGLSSAHTTQTDGIFAGNFRERGVRGLGIDLIVQSQQIPGVSTRISISLVNDGGTPSMLLDDCFVEWIHPEPTPLAGRGWLRYDFPVPSDSQALPVDWVASGAACTGDDALWNHVIESVSHVYFSFEGVGQAAGWQFGIDNARITEGPGFPLCFGEGDGSGCPCGNIGLPGSNAGCLNSSGVGAQLTASGSASVTNDTLQFALRGAPPLGFAGLASANNLLPSGQPGIGKPSFDGLRCIGGDFLRHGNRAIGADGTPLNPWGTDGVDGQSVLPSLGAIGVAIGQTRYFQVFYRDVPNASCGQEQNSSNAYSVTIEL